eukprot:7152036-Prymnesium_polylepis.1
MSALLPTASANFHPVMRVHAARGNGGCEQRGGNPGCAVATPRRRRALEGSRTAVDVHNVIWGARRRDAARLVRELQGLGETHGRARVFARLAARGRGALRRAPRGVAVSGERSGGGTSPGESSQGVTFRSGPVPL